MKVAIGLLLVGLPMLAAAGSMNEVREHLHRSHGGHVSSKVLIDQLEYRADDELAAEGDAWLGGDIRKAWLKIDAKHDRDVEALEIQALHSRAISAFWDLQVGVRHDLEPASENYAVVGLNGIAPYWFEIDGALFISADGDLGARLEAEYELRLTQRWILQPRVELNLLDDRHRDRTELEGGLRLRYEIRPQIAPYLGITWSEGGGAEAAAGLRVWF